MAGLTQRVMSGLRRDVEAKLVGSRCVTSTVTPHGDVLSRVTNDIDNLTTTIQQGLSQLITSILTIVGVMGMMFWISPLLAVGQRRNDPARARGHLPDRQALPGPVRTTVEAHRDPQWLSRGDPHGTRTRAGLRSQRGDDRGVPGPERASSTRRVFARSSSRGSSSPRCSSSRTSTTWSSRCRRLPRRFGSVDARCGDTAFIQYSRQFTCPSPRSPPDEHAPVRRRLGRARLRVPRRR